MTNALVGIIGMCGLLAGAYFMGNARSAVHEIEGLIAILIGVVGIGLSGVMSALNGVRDRLKTDAVRASGMTTEPIKPKPQQYDWLGRKVGPPPVATDSSKVVDAEAQKSDPPWPDLPKM